MLQKKDLVKLVDLRLTEEKRVELEEPVKKIMRDECQFCVDTVTGELSATELAVVAAMHFDLHEVITLKIPQDIFDWATEIVQAAEAVPDYWH